MPKKLYIEIPDKRFIPKPSRKIGLKAFISILFRQNHKLHQMGDQAWSDEILREICRRRFPKSKVVAKLYVPNSRKSIALFRGSFNTGEYRPVLDYKNYPFVSLRYDEWGNPVEQRFGRRELTPEEIETSVLHYFQLRHNKDIYVPQHIIEKLESLH